jgi:hypothetical protein
MNINEFYNSITVVGDSNAPFFAGHECTYVIQENMPPLLHSDKISFSFDLGTPCLSFYQESTIYSFTNKNIDEYYNKIVEICKDKKYLFIIFGTNDCVARINNNVDYSEYVVTLELYMKKVNDLVENLKKVSNIKKAIILSPTKASKRIYTDERLLKVAEGYRIQNLETRFVDFNIISNTVNFTGDYLFNNFSKYKNNIVGMPCHNILSKSGDEIEDRYTIDGIHLNYRGVDFLKKYIYTVLREAGKLNDN